VHRFICLKGIFDVSDNPPKQQPLQGVRVLDMSRVLAAPLAAQMLGDMGAEVIKVEQPGQGDMVRHMGGTRLSKPDGTPSSESGLFLSVNRNKQSITVDLSMPEGQALIRQLCEHCDVLIENYIPGTLQKFGLDYEAVREVNPRLVYCSVSGFGQTGPRSQQPGFDGLFQALCGLMSVNGLPDDVPGGGPIKVGPNIVDGVTGLYATIAVLAALRQRDITGRGQHADIALFDSTMHWLGPTVESYLVSGTVPQRTGNHPLSSGPSTVLRCRDGDVYFITYNQASFEKLCGALDLQSLIADPRFTDAQTRWQHRDTLAALLEARVADRPVADVVRMMEQLGCPAGRINDIAQALAEPQAVHRQIVQDMPHPLRPDLQTVANPLRLSDATMSYERPPLLGEHTDEVLSRVLGLSAEAIERLRSAKAI